MSTDVKKAKLLNLIVFPAHSTRSFTMSWWR